MASQLKVDEITTVSGTGTLKIAGNVQVNAADNTSGIVLPNGTEAQRATAPVLGETRVNNENKTIEFYNCLLYTSPSPRDDPLSRMPSSA